MFNDKVVMINGLSQLGGEAALTFARNKSKLALTDIDEERGQIVLQRIHENGGDGIFIKTDLTSAKDLQSAVNKTIEIYGRLDIAYNDCEPPVNIFKLSTDYDEQTWDRMMDVYLKSIWLCIKYELLQMRGKGIGTIVNRASIFGLAGASELAAYSAAKHGVLGLTQAAAREYSALRIRINAICPPLKLQNPESAVNVILWLCSDQSTAINGQAISIA
jgi:NAD(P)-dependent dehydrogenase (short-subunit alcohol dehydrogenase family)